MQTEQLPRLEAGEYPGGIWYYEPHTYLPYRYGLCRVGRYACGPKYIMPPADPPTPPRCTF